jgi:hypothetical protein
MLTSRQPPSKKITSDDTFAAIKKPATRAAGSVTMQTNGTALSGAHRGFLLRLQRQALQYFVDNQTGNGLILDRQRNHGPRQAHGLCSTAATGMGLIALALASAPPYRLLSPRSAALRIRTALQTALSRLPHEEGVVPHFVHSATEAVHGVDYFSTIETSWLVAGALWAAAFLQDDGLERLAACLYERVNWHYWTAPDGPDVRRLLRHGKSRDGRFLTSVWDRLNGETVFMYVLAAGAADGRALSRASWRSLQAFYGSVAGHRFHSADLGLFVFQYGLDLLDLERWQSPGSINLPAEARLATLANRQACRQARDTFVTYRRFWGLSSGDGPGSPPEPDTYRSYTPAGLIDGTAHLTTTLASVAHEPGMVLENLQEAQHDRAFVTRGRYGFSNVNVDRQWVGRDVIGIDLGAAVLAVDNFLMNNRVRDVFHSVPCVGRGLQRLSFSRVPHAPQESTRPVVRCAS